MKSQRATGRHQADHRNRLEDTSTQHLAPGMAETTPPLWRGCPGPDLEEDSPSRLLPGFSQGDSLAFHAASAFSSAPVLALWASHASLCRQLLAQVLVATGQRTSPESLIFPVGVPNHMCQVTLCTAASYTQPCFHLLVNWWCRVAPGTSDSVENAPHLPNSLSLSLSPEKGALVLSASRLHSLAGL